MTGEGHQHPPSAPRRPPCAARGPFISLAPAPQLTGRRAGNTPAERKFYRFIKRPLMAGRTAAVVGWVETAIFLPFLPSPFLPPSLPSFFLHSLPVCLLSLLPLRLPSFLPSSRAPSASLLFFSLIRPSFHFLFLYLYFFYIFIHLFIHSILSLCLLSFLPFVLDSFFFPIPSVTLFFLSLSRCPSMYPSFGFSPLL